MPKDGEDSLPARGSTSVPTTIPLGPGTTIDVGWLSADERKALLKEHVGGVLEINRKAQELHVDVVTLEKTLDTLAENTKKVSQDGNDVTITHSHKTNIGTTTIVMGNTEEAKRGKISSQQMGDRNWTPFYVLGGLVALVLIAALLGTR
jgi:hypothetical protein